LHRNHNNLHYKYTIIDPDAASNAQLQHYMEDYGDFTCTNVSTNKNEGLNTILKYSPDVVILTLNKNAIASFKMVSELHQYTWFH